MEAMGETQEGGGRGGYAGRNRGMDGVEETNVMGLHRYAGVDRKKPF